MPKKIETRNMFSKSTNARLRTLRRVRSTLYRSPYRQELSYDDLIQEIDHYFQKLETNFFQIAFVGTIKAGKSTLINALLGNHYATVNVTPETAVLTKFAASKDDLFHVKISFYTKEDWEEIWKEVVQAKNHDDQDVRDRIKPFLKEYNDLKADSVKQKWLGHKDMYLTTDDPESLQKDIANFTSSKSALHYFIKEVFVEIKDCPLPQGVVLCDTPGLDDMLSYRSDITKRYISSSHATFVCVLSKFLAGEQYNIIQQVFSQVRYTPERVYIVGTQMDLFANPAEDWNAQKAEWIKYLETKSGFGNRKLADKNILGVSAGIHLFLNENPTIEDDTDEMDEFRFFAKKYGCLNRKDLEETRVRLKEADGIDNLWKVLKENLFTLYEQTLEAQAVAELDILQEEISRSMHRIIISHKLKSRAYTQDIAELDKIQEKLSAAIEECSQKREQFQNEYNALEKATNDTAKQIEQWLKTIAR